MFRNWKPASEVWWKLSLQTAQQYQNGNPQTPLKKTKFRNISQISWFEKKTEELQQSSTTRSRILTLVFRGDKHNMIFSLEVSEGLLDGTTNGNPGSETFPLSLIVISRILNFRSLMWSPWRTFLIVQILCTAYLMNGSKHRSHWLPRLVHT